MRPKSASIKVASILPESNPTPPIVPAAPMTSSASTIPNVPTPDVDWSSNAMKVAIPVPISISFTVAIPVTSRFTAPKSCTENCWVTVRSPSTNISPVTVTRPM